MKDPRILRKYLICAFAVIVCLWSVQLFAAKKDDKASAQANTKAAEQGVPGATYVGSEQCKACHEDQYKNVQGTPHFNALGGKVAITGHEMQGCEGCHGPGSAHVEAGGDKTKIFRFKDVKTDQITERCMECHSKSIEHQGFQRSIHNRSGVTCTSCHAVHAPKVFQRLLVRRSPELCFSCHADIKGDFIKPVHHKVIEGYISCSDCHNVHTGIAEKNLRLTAQRDQTCYKCHAEKRGPFVFEHEPIRTEGCAGCHVPHGSTNPRLLTRSRVNSMCLECHQNFYNPPHPQNTKSQSCAVCHTSIHGSQTNEFFFR